MTLTGRQDAFLNGMGLMLMLFIVTALIFVGGMEVGDNIVPQCQEDEVVQGMGEFNEGRWTTYICQHPDNL